MFVILFILPESPSVVISPGLAAVVKAGDHLAVTQDIVWDLRDEGQAILLEDLQLQSSSTPTAASYGGSCDLSWPIRGQYSSQSEASILANQRPDTIKYVTERRQAELKEENCAVLIDLLFLSKKNFAHGLFCDLNKCS